MNQFTAHRHWASTDHISEGDTALSCAERHCIAKSKAALQIVRCFFNHSVTVFYRYDIQAVFPKADRKEGGGTPVLPFGGYPVTLHCLIKIAIETLQIQDCQQLSVSKIKLIDAYNITRMWW